MKFYLRYRFKLFKLSIFDTVSPNIAAPSEPILFYLFKFKIHCNFSYFNSENYEFILKIFSLNENFYFKFISNIVKFSNFEIPSHKFATPSYSILLFLINFKIKNDFSIL
jgi:hypothetical protein